jgi:hypothetical protein
VSRCGALLMPMGVAGLPVDRGDWANATVLHRSRSATQQSLTQVLSGLICKQIQFNRGAADGKVKKRTI